LNIWTDQLAWDNGWTENYSSRGTGTVSAEATTIDTDIRDDYSEFRGINFNFGMLYTPVPSVTFGAVVKTPFTASMRHRFEYRQTQTFSVSPTVESRFDLEEDVELEMPLSYGIGAAWRLSDAFTLSADIYRTHWSDYTLVDDEGHRFSPIDGRPEGESEVDDTTQVRIGAEYLIILPERGIAVPLRCGVYYDPEPASGGAKDFYGVALGSGIAWKELIVDISYNYRWGREVDAGNLIATADADVTQHIILASLIYHFE
jgi:long-subunit fatty acid transport protein